jgi:NAD(P)-dependent dehydrogenase (short-subunit alcohol dehydrogenase family)
MAASVVVITGASAGVGRATARAFAEQGASVALIARGMDGLKAAAQEVHAAGGRALQIPADVADAEEVDAAASAIEEGLGPIDVWVNNAMTSVFAPFMKIEPREFKRVTEVVYLGVVNGTKAALTRMLERNAGVIVQSGSALAYRGIPLQSAYCGAKHAIQGFTEAVRCELLHDGSNVRITTVHLPALNTPQFDWVLSRLPKKPMPVPPIFQPEIAAEAILWASQHDRREVWVGGSTVGTIIANRLFPGLLDRYLGRTGYSSQQTSDQADPSRPSNLWKPVPGDHGARGAFGGQALERSVQWWASKNRAVLGAAAGLAGAAVLAARR